MEAAAAAETIKASASNSSETAASSSEPTSASSARPAPVPCHPHDQAPPFLRQPGRPQPVHLPQGPLRRLPAEEHDEREALGPPGLAVGDDADRLDQLLGAAPSSDTRGRVERAEGLEGGVRGGDVEALWIF